MAWYSFFEIESSSTFSPKVTPEPSDAKRLEEKFAYAKQQLDQIAQVRGPQKHADQPLIVKPGASRQDARLTQLETQQLLSGAPLDQSST